MLHAGLGPEDAFSGQIAKVIAFALEAAGAPIVKGGARNLLAAFEALIKERGGDIRTGADVASIVQGNGRATGVRLASGEEISAKKSVICSVTPTQLYERLLGGAKPKSDPDAVKNYRYGKGNFQIHYALDKPPAWRGDGLGKVALLHLTPGLDGVSKACNEAARGMLPETPTICVGQPHALDPSRCPEGKAILWLQLPEAPRHIKGDAAGKLDAPADGKWTERVARGLCRSRRSDPRQPYRRVQGKRHRAARLFAGRSRSDEHQPGRRRSLWRLVDHRSVVPVAAVQGQRQPPDRGQGPLPHRRVDPSGRGPRRRLRLPPGAEAVMDQKVPEKRQRISTLGQIGLQQFAPYLMNRIMGRYNATLRDDLRKQGLTIPQVRALAVLSVMDGVTVNDLSVYTVIEQSTMSRTLDALEAQGLVRREQADADSRVRRVFLTDEGRAEFGRAWPAMHDGFETMFDGIDDAEYAALIGTLHKMLRNIRKHDI